MQYHASIKDIITELQQNDEALIKRTSELANNIQQNNSTTQAYIEEQNKQTRLASESRELINKYKNSSTKPPLYGVMLAVKDLFYVNGFSTQAGSLLPESEFIGSEAEVVSKFKNAGALIAGKTVTTEFAYFEPGPTKNPRNLTHTPGGSSSGSAAAVAANLCDVSIGTQTIGSITRPASYCGVVGFKPTYGRINNDGLVPFSPTFDQIGFFTKSICDIRYIAQHIISEWKEPSQLSSTSKITLALPSKNYLSQANDKCLEYFFRVISLLKNQGLTVIETDLFSDIETININHRIIASAEMALIHEKWFTKYKHLYKPKTIDFINTGLQVTSDQLNNAKNIAIATQKSIESNTNDKQIDLWLSPSTVGDAEIGLLATGSPIMNLPWTNAGVPTISIPIGLSQAGLPYGLQIATSFGNDEKLLYFTQILKHRWLI